MLYLKKIFFLLLMIVSFASLCSCGRYSDPSPIEGSGFPHNYPAD